MVLYLVDISSIGESVSSNVGGLNRLAGGLGESVLNVTAGNLGDGVAVLNLNGDNLHLGVVDAVLGGDLTAGVLDGGDGRVGNSVGNWGNMGNRGGGIAGISVESIGISISISLDNVGDDGSMDGGGVTDGVNNVLADLLVLNLLGVHEFLGADVLSGGNAGLGHQDLVLYLAVGSWDVVGSSSQGSSCKVGWVSIRRGSSLSSHGEEKSSENLSVHC